MLWRGITYLTREGNHDGESVNDQVLNASIWIISVSLKKMYSVGSILGREVDLVSFKRVLWARGGRECVCVCVPVVPVVPV